MHADGVTKREIARRLGISRNTVERLLSASEPPRYSRAPAGSMLDPLEGVLRGLVEEWPEIKAPRVTEILREDFGFTGSVDLVRKRLARLRAPHQHRREPGERDAAVYTRAVFVGSLAVPVLATRQLFDWWRDADWTAIRDAVLARPGESGATPPPSAPRAPEAPGNPRGARRLLGRRGSRGG